MLLIGQLFSIQLPTFMLKVMFDHVSQGMYSKENDNTHQLLTYEKWVGGVDGFLYRITFNNERFRFRIDFTIVSYKCLH